MSSSRKTYFELSRHSVTQYLLFVGIILAVSFTLFRFVGVPLMEEFFHRLLRADAIHDGSSVQYLISHDAKPESITTNLYTQWAIVDPHPVKNNKYEAKYLFNPALSLFPLIFTVSVILSAISTALLPKSLGLLRQKIYRELVNVLDNIAVNLYGEHTNRELEEIIDNILVSDVRRLHDYANTISMPYADIESVRAALEWQNSTGLMSLVRLLGAIKFYMRHYFTIQYSNTILGFVYIGAAALIIIIGIRGLKFIPGTEPSIILFALGLEFILLITYAVMVMYTKQDDDKSNDKGGGIAANADYTAVPSGIKGADDVENLLRMFVSRPKK